MVKEFIVAYLLFFLSSLKTFHAQDQPLNESALDTEIKKNTVIFQTLLQKHRVEQVAAVKQLMAFNYEQKYKMLNMMMEKVLKGIQSNKATVESSGYIPGEVLPINDTARDGLYKLLDSTALYCEFQLKLPEITDRIMAKHQDWLVLMKWAISFSNSTGFYDSKTTELLHLTAQEMNLIDRLPSFINPYRTDESKVRYVKGSSKVLKDRKNFKGPRVVKQRHTEL